MVAFTEYDYYYPVLRGITQHSMCYQHEQNTLCLFDFYNDKNLKHYVTSDFIKVSRYCLTANDIGKYIEFDKINNWKNTGMLVAELNKNKHAELEGEELQKKSILLTYYPKIMDIANLAKFDICEDLLDMAKKKNDIELKQELLKLYRKQILKVSTKRVAEVTGFNAQQINNLENNNNFSSDANYNKQFDRYIESLKLAPFPYNEKKYEEQNELQTQHVGTSDEISCKYKEIQKDIDDAKHTFSHNFDCSIWFDWLSISFKGETPKRIIENFLCMDEEHFLVSKISQNFYEKEYSYAGKRFIYIQGKADRVLNDGTVLEQEGCTLFITGQGCRIFENYLLHQKRTWNDFLSYCLSVGHAKITRCDLALNMLGDYLNTKDLIDLVNEKKYHSNARIINQAGGETDGFTLYVGKEPFKIRIYDKQLEQRKKNKYTKIKTRVEIQLCKNYAHDLILKYARFNEDMRTLFCSLLKKRIRFFTEVPNVQPKWSKKQTQEHLDSLEPFAPWECLIKFAKHYSFETKPKQIDLFDKLEWVKTQVVPTLALLYKTPYKHKLEQLIQNYELTSEQQKLVEVINYEKSLPYQVENDTDMIFEKE